MTDVYEYPDTFVNRVVDGDTLDVTVTVDIGFHIKTSYTMRIRLAGIDTPEVYGVSKESEEYQRGSAASERVRQLVEGKTVRMKTIKTRAGDERRTLGRYVADVWFRAGDVEYNLVELLLQEGLSK